MGWGPCIFRLLTVNLLTLPIFQTISMLFDGELIEWGIRNYHLASLTLSGLHRWQGSVIY